MLSEMERPREFTAFFPFCGLGAGALGFLNAEVRLFNRPSRFRSMGGIDIDKEACEDFERLTGSPALCGDMHEITSHDIRGSFGDQAPDVVFSSPPCKGFSGLLSKEAAKRAKYQRLNRLVPRWFELMLETWDPPPRLIIMENVPRITARGKPLLAEVHEMLGRAGYLVEQGYHDCGEIGGLAQHRRRFLLVARNPARCAPILYKPPIKRVRGCGEVLGLLPIPTTREAERYGRIHELPRISLMNMIRLALIPAGGDWRDIPGVLEEHQKRREVHKRHEVAAWDHPTGTVAGSGSNGVGNVADPRLKQNAFKGKYGVLRWDRASRTVIGGPSNGGAFIADPRMDSCNPNRYHNKYRVIQWDKAAKTVIGATRPGSGAPCVADPRVREHHRGVLGVREWDEPSGTVTGGAAPTRGRFSVSDPRLDCAPRAGAYGVIPWELPAGTIPGSGHIDNSGVSVADPRVKIAYDAGYKVLQWDEPAHTIAGKASCGTGAYQVADPRRFTVEGIFVPWDDLLYLPAILGMDPKRPPGVDIVIISPDGCWHRPMTTLELAALQGLPVDLGEQPLSLVGNAVSRWRERIGNAVPVQAAQAIAERMLVTLSDTQEMSLELFPQNGGDYWVEERENEHERGDERGQGQHPG